MKNESQTKFLSEKEAANLCGVSAETICKYRDLGLLTAHTVNGHEVYTESELDIIFGSRSKSFEQSASIKNQDHESKAQASEASESKPESDNEEPPTLSEILKDEVLPGGKVCSTEEIDLSSEIQPEISHTSTFTADSAATLEPQVSSIELLELTRSLKDQLEVIKEERNWLRKRVERLETTLEREQMIVMSKVETVRNLVSHEKPKPWSFLLPWKQ